LSHGTNLLPVWLDERKHSVSARKVAWQIVRASFLRLAIVVACLGSARADDRPGQGHSPADLVAANLKVGAAGGVPQLANPKDAQSAECRSTSAFDRLGLRQLR
jgi:hypothetical protein